MSTVPHDTLCQPAWDSLSPSDQRATVAVLADALQDQGFALEPRGLVDVGPFVPWAPAGRARAPRRVATLHDTRHDLDWVLIPGGTLTGWGARERELLLRAHRDMNAWRDDEEREGLSFEDIRPYSAAGFEARSMFRSTESIAPFLTSAMPVLGATKGLEGTLELERSRLLDASAGEPAVFSVLRDELSAILSPRRWSLPTTLESQWMTGAGRHVFPWGDELPRWMWDENEAASPDEGWPFEEHFRRAYESPAADFSRANDFGLVDALVASHWVRDGDALSWHGGTAECWPWQACGEWAGFISAAIAPEPDDAPAWSSHALRPVIRL